MVTEQNEWRTQNTKGRVENQKPNYIYAMYKSVEHHMSDGPSLTSYLHTNHQYATSAYSSDDQKHIICAAV